MYAFTFLWFVLHAFMVVFVGHIRRFADFYYALYFYWLSSTFLSQLTFFAAVSIYSRYRYLLGFQENKY